MSICAPWTSWTLEEAVQFNLSSNWCNATFASLYKLLQITQTIKVTCQILQAWWLLVHGNTNSFFLLCDIISITLFYLQQQITQNQKECICHSILIPSNVWIRLHTGFWISFLTSDVSSPRMSRYEMIFMACWRSSLALSKNILAKPGLFIVSREKWAPWNVTKNKKKTCLHTPNTEQLLSLLITSTLFFFTIIYF